MLAYHSLLSKAVTVVASSLKASSALHSSTVASSAPQCAIYQHEAFENTGNGERLCRMSFWKKIPRPTTEAATAAFLSSSIGA